MTYATTLTAAQVQTAQSQAQSVANSATTVAQNASDPLYQQLRGWQDFDQDDCYEMGSGSCTFHVGYGPKTFSNYATNDFAGRMAA